MHRAWHKSVMLLVAISVVAVATVCLQGVGLTAAENQAPRRSKLACSTG